MKLIIENWKKFLLEQELTEATEEQIESVKIQNIATLKGVPIQNYPFGDIFGNSYRIIEPLVSYEQGSDIAEIVDMLSTLGWEVDLPHDIKYNKDNKVIGGKLTCTKTKITHFIDGKGKQGISRNTTKVNMTKCIAGIIKFINEGYKKLEDVYIKASTSHAKEVINVGRDNPSFIYNLDSRIPIKSEKVSANTFRNIMKMFDAANYWLGFDIEETLKYPVAKIFSRLDVKGVNPNDLKQFMELKLIPPGERMSLIADFEAQQQKHYIIYSRHPIDVYRMSDFKGLGSCHTPPEMPFYGASYSERGYNEHNICALSEAHSNGMIAYAVPAKEFKDFPPTQESMDKLKDEEIFYDQNRPSAPGRLNPTARIRIKNVAYHDKDTKKATGIAVPSTIIYGAKLTGFKDRVMNKFAKLQKDKLEEITGGNETMDAKSFTRYGGGYQDQGHRVIDALPKLFKAAGLSTSLSGQYVKWDAVFENSLMMQYRRPRTPEDELRERLIEIFDDARMDPVYYRWKTHMEPNGEVWFEWAMFVAYTFKLPGKGEGGKEAFNSLKGDIEKAYFTALKSEPEIHSEYSPSNNEVKLVFKYDGDYFAEYEVYEEDFDLLQEITENAYEYIWKAYGLPKNTKIRDVLLDLLVKRGFLQPGTNLLLQSVIDKYQLDKGKSKWPITKKEQGKKGDGETYIAAATFETSFNLDTESILKEFGEDKKKEASKYVANILNIMFMNNDVAGKIVLNVRNFNRDRDTNVMVKLDNDLESRLQAKDVLESVPVKLMTGLHNDQSREYLIRSARYLTSRNAQTDGIHERIKMHIKDYVSREMKRERITENKKRIKIRVRR